MLHIVILRIIGITVIFSLLLLFTPAGTVRAARVVELNPAIGKIGDTITVTGSGFTASTESTERRVDIYFAKEEATTQDDINIEVNTYKVVKSPAVGYLDDADEGEIETTFVVPSSLNDGSDKEDVESGTYYVYVVRLNTHRIQAFREFTVGGGEITLDPEEGPVGTPLEIAGVDFTSSDDIIIEYDGDEVDIEDGDDDTDSSGDFSSVILVPESTTGVQTVTVTVGTTEVEAEFTVVPDVILSPTSGEVGTEVAVSGTGFGQSNEVTLWFKDIGLATSTSGRYGSFATTFIVPDMSATIYDVDAEDEDGNKDNAKFTITVAPPPPPPSESTPEPESTPPPTSEPTTESSAPEPTVEPPASSITGSISPKTGDVGTNLMLSGLGFEAGATVTIKYDHEEVATTTVTDEGIFIASFKVPVSKSGEHAITANDGTNTMERVFTMESEAPGVPAPLLPEMGVQAKSPVLFDWDDATDSSLPVIYSLQIATDDHFDADEIVLEITELVESEYAVTEEEWQELVGPEDPYYWRVRAVDAASNDGEWSGAGEFYIKSGGFGIPDWAIFTAVGLGGLLLFAIGYLFGRRSTSFY